MDAKAREEWRKQLKSDALPPLTAENIVATFRHVHSTRSEMFERGVISLFQRLSWDYKTNLPCRFGKRLIFQLFTMYGDNFDHSFVNQATCDELDDLTRVLHVLDGKPEPDRRDGFYRTIHSAQLEKRMGWEGEYFSLKWFRKGSGHLTFKRKDLVDQVNKIVARHFPNALPAPRQHGASVCYYHPLSLPGNISRHLTIFSRWTSEDPVTLDRQYWRHRFWQHSTARYLL